MRINIGSTPFFMNTNSDMTASEEHRTMRDLMMVALSGPSMHNEDGTSMIYYDWLVRSMDSHTKKQLEDFVVSLRQKYVSFEEYNARVLSIKVDKDIDAVMEEKLRDDCPICLKPLRGIATVCRLRSLQGDDGGDAPRCGHLFHSSCVSKLRPTRNTISIHCPVCRVDVGWPPRLWYDIEHERPRY